MPQPLKTRLGSKFLGTHYSLDAQLERRPNIAKEVGVCVAKAAACELQVFRLYLSLHRGSADIAYASFTAISGRRNRINVIKAIAATALKVSHDLDLLNATIATCETALQQRDRLAHWIWGYTDALPEEGLLVDPKTLLKKDADLIVGFEKRKSTSVISDETDSILVYNAHELALLANELIQADAMADLFRHYFHERDEVQKNKLSDYILNNPAAKARFDTARARREKAST